MNSKTYKITLLLLTSFLITACVPSQNNDLPEPFIPEVTTPELSITIPEATIPTLLPTQEATIEVVKQNPEDFYGDVYYTNEFGEKQLLTTSITLENTLAATSLDSVFYTDASLSPNGKWAALKAVCWENYCLEIYNLEKNTQNWANYASGETSWLPDNRIRVIGNCEEPESLCGTFESIDNISPWNLESI